MKLFVARSVPKICKKLTILLQDQKMAVDGKTEGNETPDAPVLPLTRSNAMIAVLKNTLYM